METPDDAVRTHRHLRRYILDGEKVTVATRLHLAKLLEPVATTVAAAVLCAWLHSASGIGWVWVLWVPVVGRLLIRWAEWNYEWFVATDKRLILTYGFIIHKVAMMPLMKVTDMGYSRTPIGQVLGYGRFVMESAGQDQALRQIDYVPDPDRTYRTLCGTIFRPGATAKPPSPSGSPPAIVPREPREPRPTTAELPTVDHVAGSGERDRHDRRAGPGGPSVPEAPIIPEPTPRGFGPTPFRRRRRAASTSSPFDPPSSDGAGTTVPDPFL